MNDHEWDVGDKAVVVEHGMTPRSVVTVRRVMAHFVETSDGAKWDHSGNRYPRSRDPWSRGPTLRPHTEQLESELRRRRALDSLHALARNANAMTDDALFQILRIWKADEERRGEKK